MTEIKVERLKYLAGMLSKYREAFYRGLDKNGQPSCRIAGWCAEYDAVREEHPEAWALYCAEEKCSRYHSALDVLA